MTEISVRPCTRADLPTLRAFEPREGTLFSEQYFTRQEEGEFLFATAWDDEGPLGWGTLDLSDIPLQPQLGHLWVFPQARRRGVGRSLSEWLEDQARQRGFREVFLRVDPQNSAAIPLWIDLGYTPTGEHDLATDDATGKTSHHAIYRKSLTIAE